MDASDDEIVCCTPPDIREQAKAACLELLPKKSRHMYDQQYNKFLKWMNEKKIKKITENVMMAYFSETATRLKPSTLWSHYSMLRATIAIKQDVHINTYVKLIAFLKQKSANFKPKKSKTFLKSEVVKFLLDAPDEMYLLMKVVTIFGLAGALRCDELCKLAIGDIEDKGNILIVKVPHTKTKQERVFTVTDGHTNNIQLYRKYVLLRPPAVPNHRLFLTYRAKKCTIQPVGINTYSKIPKQIADFLHLADSDLYTGHCFRRTSASLLANNGGDLLSLKRHGGWRSNSVAEGYVDDALSNKLSIADKILGCSNNNLNNETVRVSNFSNDYTVQMPPETCDLPVTATNPAETTINIPSDSDINFGGIHNCTINFYYKQ